MMRLFKVLIVLFLFSSQVLHAQIGCAYAQRGINSFSQQILRIDPITGNFDTLSTLNGFSGGTTALAIDSVNGRCFLSGWDTFFVHHIFTMSLSSGQILQQPISEGQYNLGDLQYHAPNGFLYTLTSITTNSKQLLRIDPLTGNFDTLGTYTGFGGGSTALTIDAAGNLGYFTGPDSASQFRVYTLDLITGSLLSSPLLETQQSLYDPQFKTTNQLLYTHSGLNSAVNIFLEIDPQTGDCDTIGTITGFAGGTTSAVLTDNNEYLFLGFDSVFNYRVYSLNLATGFIATWPLADVQAPVGDPSFIYKCVAFNFNGIAENDLDEQVHVYPNPSNTFFQFTWATQNNAFTTVSIYDGCGKEIHNTNINSDTGIAIDASTWDSGIYFYRLVTENGQSVSGKLLVR
jgi:hypothetical protein